MSIHVENLTFSYGERNVLSNVQLFAASGQRIGIVGSSGCGKSTLLKLLAGLYRPQIGRVRIQGAAEPADIRRMVSLVMQNALLFPFTIRDNITCGHSMEESRILEACRAAQLMDWLETLPDGLDTCVGERGGQVSGGQAQRIAIARAMAKEAPVVLLDEATSALDADTSQALLLALQHLTEGKTVVSVSHHPETFAGFTAVYRLEGGRLYES